MTFKAHLETLASVGLTPYVASSRAVLDALDLTILGRSQHIYLLEREEDRAFHEAVLVANANGFPAPRPKMPGWVLIDYVLMQTAVIGFAIARHRASTELIKVFEADESVELERLDYLPVSGLIAGRSLDGKGLVGSPLFSLRRYLPAVPALGVITKMLALLAYRAQGCRYTGLSQYDNRSLAMQGKFGKPIWIETPRIPLHHPMSLIYGMTIDFDPDEIHEREPPGDYDFLMRADDDDKKRDIADGIADGRRYLIVPPYQIESDGIVELPIRVERAP